MDVMKKSKNIGLLMILLAFFSSCEKYDMVEFGESGEINFRGRYLNGSKYYWSDDEKYLEWEKNFGMNVQGDSLLQDTVIVGVKIMGEIVNYPRKVVLTSEAPAENALEVIFPEEYYVPADTAVATFRVIVKRPATRNITYTTKLMFDYSQSDFEAGTQERQVFNLKAEDKVSMELWGITQEDWEYEPVFFFGEWSETKMRYMITMLGCVSFMNWYYNEDSFFEALMGNVLYASLEEYKADSSNPPLLDENTGEWIEFPDLSEMM